jgi:hypothetical protein
MKLTELIKMFREANKGQSERHIFEVEINHILELTEKAEKMQKALEFYAQGGHPAMDMWQHPELGYFTGKRACQVLAEVDGE